ncbi:hypothetical protein SELMODRAFT_402629 [Selaginella moellendorffii]|uniref:Protein dpy-30 homolog n=2 Tax=Selaginella moellendorffii TaxID=88036 RepID=D8QMJ0_SELML|nr:hypothetical protein SELMODRAFT_408246 [Selaginella moellendorffii]EFJ37943.1 hypothetical protein SELMODRAFT_402629 [Selaginella moellendorffii]
MASESGSPPPPSDQEMAEAKAMPVRQYLETRVVPLLLQGMQRLVIERPVDPVEFLAKYLTDNNPRKKVEEKPKEGEGAPADAAAAPGAAAPAAPPAAPAK